MKVRLKGYNLHNKYERKVREAGKEHQGIIKSFLKQ
jgi:hypothetical protein